MVVASESWCKPNVYCWKGLERDTIRIDIHKSVWFNSRSAWSIQHAIKHLQGQIAARVPPQFTWCFQDLFDSGNGVFKDAI
jgi:hypothetical protein